MFQRVSPLVWPELMQGAGSWGSRGADQGARQAPPESWGGALAGVAISAPQGVRPRRDALQQKVETGARARSTGALADNKGEGSRGAPGPLKGYEVEPPPPRQHYVVTQGYPVPRVRVGLFPRNS